MTPPPTTIPSAIAHILHCFHPDARRAFWDFDRWFSVTWICNLAGGGDVNDDGKHGKDGHETTTTAAFEISRIRRQVSVGSLDADGCWILVLVFDVAASEDGDVDDDGQSTVSQSTTTQSIQHHWHPLPSLSMRHTTPPTISALALTLLQTMTSAQTWLSSKSRPHRHEFYVELDGPADMDDPGADGLAIYPGWLYGALDLGLCAACREGGCEGERGSLSKCARCGTAAYCSRDCQRRDWAAHRVVCGMDGVGRGRALLLSSREGGLGGGNGGGGGNEDDDDDDDAEDSNADEQQHHPNPPTSTPTHHLHP
ncbi:hypothetical protein EJ05DRAFT_503090 [Pseudovirgaria hyperparasitica]|uniref:MYND-type domain-containing protein n=1 Tax=Pseudovirgaria hyperparasitica TaxID=470096 RepID=A0A6A6W0G8_9PEZI|nr:uncharacterized protein EJ05DRAFT_503090 [Pseudovirgaria hyperparasitica]KAF2755629.1 hypothetical protein EJ05DRAFT_503090 [Pseudovirgaria hyperparasitica]